MQFLRPIITIEGDPSPCSGDLVINDNICQFETYNKNGLNFGVQNFSGLQIYTKTLIGSNGCGSTVILRLNVYPNPVNVVDFGIVLGLAGTTTTFNNQSIYTDESMIAGWEWYLDDDPYPFATTKDASTVIATAGAHTVSLKVKSINGCWDDISKNITIDPCPVPTLIVNKTSEIVCGLEIVTIKGSFEDADKISIQTLNSNGKKARVKVLPVTNLLLLTVQPLPMSEKHSRYRLLSPPPTPHYPVLWLPKAFLSP